MAVHATASSAYAGTTMTMPGDAST